MIAKNPLISYFGIPKQTVELKSALENHQAKVQIYNLIGSSFAVTAAATIDQIITPQIFIFRDKEEASYFINDIENLLERKFLFFPSSYRRPYQIEETDNANILLRSEVLNKISQTNNPIIVTYSEAISEKVISRKELKNQTIILSQDQNLKINDLEKMICDLNFEKVDFVIQAGQYSIRGGIVDIFSFADENPFRLEFFDTKIESIRSFNINTQLSIKTEKKIKIIANTQAKNITSQVSFLEYLPKKTVVWIKDIKYTKDVLNQNFNKAILQYKNMLDNALQHSKPEYLFTSGDNFLEELEQFRIVENNNISYFKNDDIVKINTSALTKINKKFDILRDNLIINKNKGLTNIILCSSKEQEERLKAIFENTQEKLQYKCIQLTLHEGYIDFTNNYAIYTDHQIFDRYHKFKSRTKFTNNQAITIKQLNSLVIGDFVTHIDHGIGKFEGLHKIENNGKYQEVIKILYKQGDILYISIHSLHKISKFSGKEGLEPKINQLGSPTWQKTKLKAKTRVKQVAFDLIKLYAKRKLQKGFQFSPDTYLQHELEASFMYEDTPDQNKATISVKEDMEKSAPMDRLICGDVGFGKTEIAIRAAFKAVADSKQVAILVPTTVLALQHYKTFKKRFSNLPCNIDYISRFKTKKEQKKHYKK